MDTVPKEEFILGSMTDPPAPPPKKMLSAFALPVELDYGSSRREAISSTLDSNIHPLDGAFDTGVCKIKACVIKTVLQFSPCPPSSMLKMLISLSG